MSITGAEYEVTLSSIDIKIKPITDRLSDELDNWVRKQYLIQVKAYASLEEDKEFKREFLKDSMSTAASLTWMFGEGLEILTSVDGLTRLMWIGCQNCEYKKFQEAYLNSTDAEKEVAWDQFNLSNPSYAIKLLGGVEEDEAEVKN